MGQVHLFVAVQMFFWCLAFGLIGRIKDTLWMLLLASFRSV